MIEQRGSGRELIRRRSAAPKKAAFNTFLEDGDGADRAVQRA